MQEPVSPQPAAGDDSWRNAKFHLHQFSSRSFRNTRMLRVWLPPGYDAAENSTRGYPVLYLNDGQNLFDSATAFAGVSWAIGGTADRLIRDGAVIPLIVVGIDNAQTDRMKEYLPYRTFQPPILRPRGKHYPEFLINEVMPFIGGKYRVASGAENTGLGGSSLGALISLYTAINRPGVFGRLLLESPSLYIAQRRVLNESRYAGAWPAKVYAGIGTREAGRDDKDRQVVEDVRELERILQKAGLGADRLRVRIDEGATHNEGEWAKRFPEALTFLFAVPQAKS
jgi:enterochelin esterase-like enzyme